MKPLILLVAIGILVWGNPTAADDPKAIKTKVRLGVDGDLVAAKATKIMIIRHAEKPPSSPPPDGVNVNGPDRAPQQLEIQRGQSALSLARRATQARGAMFHLHPLCLIDLRLGLAGCDGPGTLCSSWIGLVATAVHASQAAPDASGVPG